MLVPGCYFARSAVYVSRNKMRPMCGARALSTFTIGDLRLKSRVILSPLERISDVGFRRLCYERGAGLTWTEMVYASELVRPAGSAASNLAAARRSPRGNRGANLIDTHDAEVLTGVQLLVDRTTQRDGWGVDLLQTALEALEEGAATDRPEPGRPRSVPRADFALRFDFAPRSVGE